MNDDTGTDRVADVEAQIQADFEAHPGSWRGDPEGWFREGWLVQEARLQALAVELDELKEEVSEYVFEYIPLIAGQRDKAEADLDAARAEAAELRKSLDYWVELWKKAANGVIGLQADLSEARAELAAANARCAELEKQINSPSDEMGTFNQCEVHGKCVDENWNDDAGESHAGCLTPAPHHVKERLRLLHKIDRQRKSLRSALDQRDVAESERDALQATLDRVTALADEWDKSAGEDRDVESKTLRSVAAYLRAAVQEGAK